MRRDYAGAPPGPPANSRSGGGHSAPCLTVAEKKSLDNHLTSQGFNLIDLPGGCVIEDA